jgi:anti-anti-sigma regulatory factor
VEPTPFQASIRRNRRGNRIRLTGNIDLTQAVELHRAACAIADSPGHAEVDCRRLAHLSAAALQVLAALAIHLRAQGFALRAIGPPSPLRPWLEAAGLDISSSRQPVRSKE